MSELSNLIFKNAKHYISSPYGKRNVISTSAGKTSAFHSGIDYATYGKKLPQYAVADGVVLSCGCDTAYGGALYVWVKYPGLGVRMLHYHLDSYCVKAGQIVKKGTLLGYTGQTGKATGIHLHLGLKLLSGGGYIDPEKWWNEHASGKASQTSAQTSAGTASQTKDDFLPARGYFKKGDTSPNVGKIAAFMRKTFPGYTSEKALGNVYGDNLIKAVKEFQKRTELTADGCIGEKTLAKLIEYGFKV